MAPVSPARKAAFKILMVVERGLSHSDDLLRGKAVSALSAADRHLATALVLGVLRWQIRIDHQLKTLLKRPDAKLDPEVLIALRMGAFQILHMDRIPARAAIDESVELAKQAGHRFASGMVNAVLRKLPSEPATQFSEDSAAELALAQAHPAWLVERFVRNYGLEAARSVCQHGQRQPVHAVRLMNADAERELNEAGVCLKAGEFLTAARHVVSGDVTAATAFREGRARLQDEGSQLIAEIAGHAAAILDCCAAPGGKTLILAERNPDARIVACESNAERLAQLRERLAPVGERVQCRLADSSALIAESAFDLALADVPCSGTGTLGRNPEIRHRLHPVDLVRQAERQRAILLSAIRALRPGGRVVYSTCSLEPEENEQVVAAVLSEATAIRPPAMESRIESLRAEGILTDSGAEALRRSISGDGYLRLMPGAFQTDGFFVCLLEKTG